MPGDEATWSAYLADAVEWHQRTGQIHRGDGHPGAWVGRQRSALRGGAPCLTRERIARLDRALPGWREARAFGSRDWDESAKALLGFVKVEGRLPRQLSEDTDERRLEGWLSWQRMYLHRGALRRDRVAWLDEHVPGWLGQGPRGDTWARNAQELGEWVRSTGQFPRPRSEAADERRLGYRLKNRRGDARAGRLTAERIALLNDVAPGWRRA